MRDDVAAQLQLAWRGGADLINAPMFRPDKPLALYPVSYLHPRRQGGGNVWAHLRAFRKSLYDLIPMSAFETPVGSTDCLIDYLTMVPMAELARRPVSLNDGYYYLHEREPYSVDRKDCESELKRWLFTQNELAAP